MQTVYSGGALFETCEEGLKRGSGIKKKKKEAIFAVAGFSLLILLTSALTPGQLR